MEIGTLRTLSHSHGKKKNIRAPTKQLETKHLHNVTFKGYMLQKLPIGITHKNWKMQKKIQNKNNSMTM
jgi:hypothetical protein